MKLLIVCERFVLLKSGGSGNGGAGEDRWERWERAARKDPPDVAELRRWLDCSLAHSCFRRACGPNRKRLEAVGLRDALLGAWCMHLLPPAAANADWHAGDAARVGLAMVDWALEEHLGQRATHLIALGARVATALLRRESQRFERGLIVSDDGMSALPLLAMPAMCSPSWNLNAGMEEIAEVVEEFLG
jgi:hypothetical protein